MVLGLALLGCGAAPVTPCIDDVPSAFAAIPNRAEAQSLTVGALFDDDPVAYTLTPENDFGIDNHLQGIAAVGDTLFVSGGDFEKFDAHVWYGTADGLTVELDLDAGPEWHAGGLASLDHWLVVPTEELRNPDGASSVRVFDVSDPESPVLTQVIERAPGTRSHAAGLVRTEDAVLLFSWNDRELDVYRGSPDLDFESTPFTTLDASTATSAVPEIGTPGVNGQAVSMLAQCDGTIFGVFTDNTTDLPFDGGQDFADLVRIDVAAGTLEKVASRAFDCPPEQGCNFRAAASAYVRADQGLDLLSTAFFRGEDGTIPWARFSAPDAR